MKKPVVVFFTLLIAVAGIVVPIWLAVAQAERQAFAAESAHVLTYARDVLMRADETGRQIQAGVARLAAQHGDEPCSPASIDLMREIDLGSTYIQAMGHVRGNRLVCSSITGAMRGLDLGPPDYRNSRGTVVRGAVRFPFAPRDSFLVIETGGFAAIVHPRLAIDTAKSEPEVSLAVLSLERPRPMVQRGRIDPGWVRRLGTQREAVFIDGDQVVAIVRSERFVTAGVAAVPLRYLEGRSQEALQRLVPAGLAAGVAIALAIGWLARQQMSLSFAVRSALRRNEFFLEYQPVVELQSGRWIGVEALVRWRRATGEVIAPDLFIPIAEQHGMIDRLTSQVLDMVVRDTGSWLSAHPDFHVGINVAPADFHAAAFLPGLQDAVGRAHAHPGNLILEVTERALLDPAVAREVSGALRRRGFAVAIDDFGTGYSSLSYLESLELDYLKIDRSFIEAIGTGAPISQVVGHIIGMARDLGLRMIAEGVESQAQADYLRRLGVQYGQGWLFGRPMPFWQVVRHLELQAAHDEAALRAAG